MKKTILLLFVLLGIFANVNAQSKKTSTTKKKSFQTIEVANAKAEADKKKQLNAIPKKVVVATAKEEKMVTTY